MRADGRDRAVENAAGERVDLDLHLLADAKRRAVGFGDIGQHPHRVDVGDRIRRRRVARLHEQARRGVARRDPAGDRAWHDQRRIGDALGNDAVDLGIGLAEQPHRIARRAQIAFGGLLVGRGLLDVALRHRLRRVEPAQTSQIRAVRSATPAAAIRVDSACRRSGLSIVNSVWPFFTSSPTAANSEMIRPW